MERLDTNTLLELITQLKGLEFHPFTKNDWAAYSGCNSEIPYIAYSADGSAVFILDGAEISRMTFAGLCAYLGYPNADRGGTVDCQR